MKPSLKIDHLDVRLTSTYSMAESDATEIEAVGTQKRRIKRARNIQFRLPEHVNELINFCSDNSTSRRQESVVDLTGDNRTLSHALIQ